MFTFWMGAAGCIKRATPGSELEGELRSTGRALVPASELRRLTFASRAERIAWFAEAKGLSVVLSESPDRLQPEESQGRATEHDDGSVTIDTPEGERFAFPKGLV